MKSQYWSGILSIVVPTISCSSTEVELINTTTPSLVVGLYSINDPKPFNAQLCQNHFGPFVNLKIYHPNPDRSEASVWVAEGNRGDCVCWRRVHRIHCAAMLR